MKVKLYIIVGICSWFAWAAAFTALDTWMQNPITDYYETEVAVSVSPHGLRKLIDKQDKSFVLVDLRSEQEYDNGHIVGAVNIPAYKDPDTSAYDDTTRIIGDFKKLTEFYADRSIIVYCYSMACMTGRKIGKMLADKGIYVQHLGIGRNERKYHWNLRNHEHERTQTSSADYISTGTGDMSRILTWSTSCPIDNEFWC